MGGVMALLQQLVLLVVVVVFGRQHYQVVRLVLGARHIKVETQLEVVLMQTSKLQVAVVAPVVLAQLQQAVPLEQVVQEFQVH